MTASQAPIDGFWKTNSPMRRVKKPMSLKGP